MSRHRTTAAALLVLLAAWGLSGTASAAVPRLVFPVVADTFYFDDFGAPRGSGRHQGNDLVAAKRSPVVAVEAGRVVKWTSSRTAGCMLYLHGRSGTEYMYVHLNNDRTLRNDNAGGCKNGIAYAPGLVSNQQVQAGQLIAYVGDSGDANGIVSHLHFELHPNGGAAASPYRRLRAAYRHLYPRPAAAVETLRMRVHGTVVAAFLDLDPQRIRIRVTQLRLSNGWIVKPKRDVTLSVPVDAALRRSVPGTLSEPTTIDRFTPGSRVIVWANEFPQDLLSARAAPGLHTIRDILLLSD